MKFVKVKTKHEGRFALNWDSIVYIQHSTTDGDIICYKMSNEYHKTSLTLQEVTKLYSMAKQDNQNWIYADGVGLDNYAAFRMSHILCLYPHHTPDCCTLVMEDTEMEFTIHQSYEKTLELLNS